MILQPHHIALKVLDLDRCAQFYSEVLGLRSIQTHSYPNGLPRSVWYDLGGVLLMLEHGEGVPVARETAIAQDPPPPGWHLLALTITPPSRAEWRARLEQAGVRITGETAYSIYFRDPENNRLALSHYPAPGPGADSPDVPRSDSTSRRRDDS